MNENSTTPNDGPGRAIGLVYGESGPELALGTVPVTDAVRQPFGLVHGGVYSLIAESIVSHATGAAVAADGMVAMGQSNSATFLRPISEGSVHATGRRRHGGRSSWVWDVEITDDDDRLCAMVRVTVAIRPRPAS